MSTNKRSYRSYASYHYRTKSLEESFDRPQKHRPSRRSDSRCSTSSSESHNSSDGRPAVKSKKEISTRGPPRMCRPKKQHYHRRRSYRSNNDEHHRMCRSKRGDKRCRYDRSRSVSTSSSDGRTSRTPIVKYEQHRSGRCRTRHSCGRSCQRRSHRSHCCHRRFHRSSTSFNERHSYRHCMAYNRCNSVSTSSSDDGRSSFRQIPKCERSRSPPRRRPSKCGRRRSYRSYRLRSRSSSIDTADRNRQSKNDNGHCISCNRDQSRAERTFCPSDGHASKLRNPISICEKSTQTDNVNDGCVMDQSCDPLNPICQDAQTDNVDDGYMMDQSCDPRNPICQDASTANNDALPDLTDSGFIDSFFNQLTDGSYFDVQSANVSSNYSYANPNNQHVAETLIDQTQAAAANVKNVNGNSGENTADGANQVCHVKLTRIYPHIYTPKVKNIHPEWHCLSEKKDCKVCGKYCNNQYGLVKHYVIVHPTVEVIPSRVTPDTAKDLRSSSALHECKKIKYGARHYKFAQFCYFCNLIKTFSISGWKSHLARHTGCFEFTSYCESASESASPCEWINVKAYLCSNCNYVRFNGTDIEAHLSNEHGYEATTNFKEVTFVRFMKTHGDRWQGAEQLGARVDWFKSPLINQLQVVSPRVKNNNPEWHCLNKAMGFVICKSRDSTAGHYVNVHPNTELVISRLDPSVANFLRSLKYSPSCKIVNGSDIRLFKQYCYFCNESKCFGKTAWIDHITRHTGYFRRQYYALLGSGESSESKASDASTQLKEPNVTGYLCDWCNFVRLDKTEIQNHLRNEHDDNNYTTDDFEEIVFLTFPDHQTKRRRLVESESE